MRPGMTATLRFDAAPGLWRQISHLWRGLTCLSSPGHGVGPRRVTFYEVLSNGFCREADISQGQLFEFLPLAGPGTCRFFISLYSNFLRVCCFLTNAIVIPGNITTCLGGGGVYVQHTTIQNFVIVSPQRT